jgi:hypothetical protein
MLRLVPPVTVNVIDWNNYPAHFDRSRIFYTVHVQHQINNTVEVVKTFNNQDHAVDYAYSLTQRPGVKAVVVTSLDMGPAYAGANPKTVTALLRNK